MTATHNIYLEIGKKKAFACAVDWPGWCRSGRDEASAIQNLLVYSERYMRVIQSTDLEFSLPGKATDFNVIERIAGNSTTDFGVPAMPISRDHDPTSPSELQRFTLLLKATWRAFDQAVNSARGKQLRKGPRGGGRDLKDIISHVLGAEAGYLRQLGWNVQKVDEGDLSQQVDSTREQVIHGLQAAADGQLPKAGPRGGKRWAPRYFIRRSAWHVLDHAWEIEDRIR